MLHCTEVSKQPDVMGHQRRLKHLAATSAITLNADIRLRCNICRNGPNADIALFDYLMGPG